MEIKFSNPFTIPKSLPKREQKIKKVNRFIVCSIAIIISFVISWFYTLAFIISGLSIFCTINLHKWTEYLNDDDGCLEILPYLLTAALNAAVLLMAIDNAGFISILLRITLAINASIILTRLGKFFINLYQDYIES
jgi:hypothetical protein